MRKDLAVTVVLIAALLGCGGGKNAGSQGAAMNAPSDELPRSDLPPLCFLDWLGGVGNPAAAQPVRVSGSGEISFSGWAVDESAKTPAGGVDIVIDGVARPATYGLDRPDVAAAHRTSEYAKSGFALTLPPNSLPKGPHTVSLRVISADKKLYYRAPAIPFEVQ